MSLRTDASSDINATFARLRQLLRLYEGEMVVVHVTADTYYLNTRAVTEKGTSVFFGSVSIRKDRVSFHLYPLYMHPDLLDGIGQLRKRMQGKSCFNFKRIDDGQIGDLEALVRAGYERFSSDGLIQAISK